MSTNYGYNNSLLNVYYSCSKWNSASQLGSCKRNEGIYGVFIVTSFPFYQGLVPKPQSRVAVLMGSPTDMDHSEKIKTTLKSFGVPCELRVTSAHKGTDETKKILADYEGEHLNSSFVFISWPGFN